MTSKTLSAISRSTPKDLLTNNFSRTQDAVVRNFEIIGEATKNLPDDFKTLYPSVAWKQVAGLRDVIAHGYFRVDFEVLWEIITDTLPDFKIQILKILKKERKREKELQK